MTKLLICGSRKVIPGMYSYAVRAVDRAYELGWELVVGDADGIDCFAMRRACRYGMPLTIYSPMKPPRNACCMKHRQAYKHVFGHSYLLRDEEMVVAADKVLAIWNGYSHGTIYTYNYALKMGKEAWLRTFR